MRVVLPKMFVGFVLMVSVLLSSMGGCATIRNEKYKEVGFTSEPSGAVVSMDGDEFGVTPCEIEIARKGRDKVVEISLDGYKTAVLKLNRSVEGKTVFGGLIGMSVDAISGKAGTYTDSVHVILEVGEGTVELDSKVLDQARKDAETDGVDGG
tara:strand:+ start:3553 stop:4011 length:459 start_codon:yes stop_codon:yes gene_type:complete